MPRTLRTPLALFVTLLAAAPAFAQSGKIAGRVTDAVTGEGIPGASAIVVETAQGDAADLDGYYTILNVAPGRVTVRISAAGYGAVTVENVDVNIQQTSTVDVELQGADIGEVVVRAERPVVETDVSNSRLNVSAEEIEALPVSDVGAVVGLQAGIQGDFLIRGSGADEIAFQVNGLTLRDERNNAPYTNISVASIEEVQVQTGGFNAEYGNVRSGVVNVVTKEGDRDRYEVDGIFRYGPPAQKNFGQLANDPDSYWIRPFLDPDVAMVGTDAWDPITRSQYAPFAGWIAVSEERLRDDDPTNDLSPEALQQAFRYQHRKPFNITQPDYDVDLGFGGPVPGLRRKLGDLRFYASYRREEDLYLMPLHTDRYREQSGHLKVTSNVARGMKLSLEGRMGNSDGTTSSRSGATPTGRSGTFRSAASIADDLTSVSFIDSRIFSGDYWGPSETRYNQQGLSFTHTLSSNTFYEARLNRFASSYDVNPGPRRDESTEVTIGGVAFDEGPFGWQPFPSEGVDGMRMGVGMSNARDSSEVIVYNGRLDLTSQLNRFMEVKTGVEYNLTRSLINYARVDSFLTGSNARTQWDQTPVRGAAYGQTKLEFRGMIANLGLRLDYSHAGGEWYEYADFEPTFSGVPVEDGDPRVALDSLLTTAATERQVTLSPRLGVSFPVTSVSKLYFNYGHFRSLPDPDRLYLVRAFASSGQITQLGNPNLPLPKTVAYELGYEQAFFGQFLARIAGYYKDVSLLPRQVSYVSRDGRVDYSVAEPNSYQDIRGFEFTFARNRGRWLQGFVNYTYQVTQSGYFGFRTVFENTTEQREQEESDAALFNAFSRPQPLPYGRVNLDLLTPDDFGPRAGGLKPLADWRVSFIGRWQDGGQATWADGFSALGVSRNVEVRDFYSLDLRASRTFDLGDRRLTLFADVFNLLDRKSLSSFGFIDGNDRLDYYASLHFPASDDYSNVPGDDVVGDFREPGVAFEPICSIGSSASDGSECARYGGLNPDLLYYDRETQRYLAYDGTGFVAAENGRVERVLDTKAYIDMPNQGFLTFLGPRDVFVGLRLNF